MACTEQTARKSTGGKRNETSSLTGMLLGFQELADRIIVERTTIRRTTNTQIRVPSIMDIIGCDITIENIQAAKRELIKQKFDLKMDVNESQSLPNFYDVTPLLHSCRRGNLLIVRLLFLIGADYKTLQDICWFPMLAAAESGHLDICKWLCEYGGDARYQINKETTSGFTPLRAAYTAWHYGHGIDKEGKTCRWLLLNGGGQYLSSDALRCFIEILGIEETNSNLLVLWMRENIQLHGTFILLLCGASTMITSSPSPSSSETNDGGTRKHKCARKIHPERSLQILDGHPGIMEVIGDYVGLIRGKEFRMVEEFNESVIEYMKRHESSNDFDTGEGEE